MTAIYKITNKINQKSYIGFDSNYPNRIKCHERMDGTSPKLDEAVKQYGWNNFRVKVLYKGKNKRHTLKIKEPYYIKKYSTKFPKGYNLTNGGQGSLGYKHTDESKNKLRYIKTTEHKKKISLSILGTKKGPPSEKTKKKISLSHIGKSPSQETKNKISNTLSKKWKIIFPDGHQEIILGMNRFCDKNNLTSQNLIQGYSKGYRCLGKV